MSLKLVEIFGEIHLRDRAFRAALLANRSSVMRLTGSLAKLRQASMAVFTGLALGSALVGRTYGQFEQSMALVRSITRSTKDEMIELSDKAREMGAATIFTASESAEAMAEMARAGLKNREILEAVKPTLDLAASAQIGLSDAVKISIAAMRNMDIPTSRLGEVIDALSIASDDAQLVVKDLGAAMRRLGPVAQISGQSLQTTLAALIAIGKQGIIGREAGTQLRSLILRIQRGTEGVAKALQALGLEVSSFFTKEGKFMDMADMVDLLNERLRRLDPVTRQWAITTIAGMRNTAALSLLLRNGGDRLREMAASYLEHGVAAEKAQIQIDTFFGSLRLLTSAFQELLIQIGAKVVPIFRSMAEQTRELILILTRLPEGFKETAAQITVVLAGAATLVGLTFALIAAFTILTNPLVIIAGAFSTLLSTLIFVNIEGDTLEKKLISLNSSISKFITSGLDVMRDALIEVAYWIAALTTFILRFNLFIELSLLKVERWAKGVTDSIGEMMFDLGKYFGLIDDLGDYDPTGGEDTRLAILQAKIDALEQQIGASVDMIFKDLIDNWIGVFDQLAQKVREAFKEDKKKEDDIVEEIEKKVAVEFKWFGLEDLSKKIQEAVDQKEEDDLAKQMLEEQQQAGKALGQIRDVVVNKFDGIVTAS